MIKELRYLFYVIVVFIFFILTLKFYFSDINKKNSYRSFKQIEKKTIIHSQDLILLESDTNNIVEYIEKTTIKDKKNYNFWKLITNND